MYSNQRPNMSMNSPASTNHLQTTPYQQFKGIHLQEPKQQAESIVERARTAHGKVLGLPVCRLAVIG